MRFELTEDQRDLQTTLRAFVEHRWPSPVSSLADRDAADVWARLTGQMELTGLAIDGEIGGAGVSFVEVGVALEELGRTLVPVPFLSTVVAAHVLGAGAPGGPAKALLARIVSGAAATVALAGDGLVADGSGLHGRLEHVIDASRAELLVTTAVLDGELALVAVDLADRAVRVCAQPALDHTRDQATVELTGCPAVRLSADAAGAADLARARDVLSVAYACESVGAASRCLETTIAYLTERVQFGRPIGSFQAIKHRCADLFVELESARSTAAYASWVVDGAPHELASVAGLAQLVCVEALLHIAGESIQLHGGIGFTWEHGAHLYFKRAKSTELLSGGSARLRRAVGERAGIL